MLLFSLSITPSLIPAPRLRPLRLVVDLEEEGSLLMLMLDARVDEVVSQ